MFYFYFTLIKLDFIRTSDDDGRVRGQVLAGSADTSPLGEINIVIIHSYCLTGGDGGTPPSA